MSYKSKKPDELRESDTLFFHAEDISEPTIVVRWGDLKEHLRNELLSSFPEKKVEAPASIDPEFLKPVPEPKPQLNAEPPLKHLFKVEFKYRNPVSKEILRYTDTFLQDSVEDAISAAKSFCKKVGWEFVSFLGAWQDGFMAATLLPEAKKTVEEPDMPNKEKSVYKVEFVCLNSCKEGEVKSHTCAACSEEGAIEETKRHCKVIQCDYRMAIGIWKDGLWCSAGDLAVQNPQKAKEPSPFNTYLVKYEETITRTEFDFLSVADSEIGAINQLLKDKISTAPAGLSFRIVSVGLFDHSKTNH